MSNEAFINYGNLLRKFNNEEQAKKMYEEALKLDPQNQESKKALDELYEKIKTKFDIRY